MKRISIALAVCAAALGLSLAGPAPHAFACGGYRVQEPPEHSFIRAVMQQHAERRADVGAHWVQAIELDGDRASVVLRYEHARSHVQLEQRFTLARGGDAWRVVSRDRAVRVA